MEKDNFKIVNEKGLNDVLFHSPIIDKETSKKIVTGYASIDKPWLKFYEEGAMTSELPSMTMYDYLCQGASKYFDKPALNYFDTIINYGEFFKKIEEVASALVGYGVKEGDIVTLITPTVPESIYLLYAINKIGAVSNFIDPRTSKEGIEDYVKEAGSDLVFIVDVVSDKASNLKDCGVKTIVNMSPTESMSTKAQIKELSSMIVKAKEELINSRVYSGKFKVSVKAFKKVIKDLKAKKMTFGYSDECMDWSKFIDFAGDDIKPFESLCGDGDTPAVIVHTGGTTGTPKGVILTNNNLNYAAFDCINAGYDFKSEHNWLNIMPLFIAYGCGNGLHLPLICKMEVIVIPAFETEMMPDLLNKYHPNHMVGVPSHYGTIISSPKLQDEDLSYVIAPTVGGDSMDLKLEESTNRFLAAHNCPYKVVKGYGLTEVSAAVCGCVSNETNSLGSVGIPFPHSVVAIFDSKTKEELPLTVDSQSKNIGEICISGPNLMKEYFNNPEETDKIRRLHDDGLYWIHSGDLGWQDENGELYVIGREKDMIIRHDGFKIYPSLIEQVIMKDDDVLECKVVGISDGEYSQGELPYVYVVAKKTANLVELENRLRKLCDLSIQEYAIPVGYEFIDSLPQTNIGKIDIRGLKEKANTSKKLVKGL